jgi:hypothetical protein
MKRDLLQRAGARAVAGVFALMLLASGWTDARATSWKGIEPLKSRRADVERALGAPVRETPAEAALHFNVMGGRVTVFFVTAKFVAAKKTRADLEGTVLQIVLQHERASDTPESLGVDKNKNFEREAGDNVVVYRNLEEGVIYTFSNGKLQTTRYLPPADALARVYKKG